MEQQLFQALLRHVWQHSPFYQEFYWGHGITEKDLADLTVRDLPRLSKETLMENFDAAVTDPRLRKHEVERWLEKNSNPRDLYCDEFIVVRSSGGSSTIGIFVYHKRAWQIMASTAAPRLHQDTIAGDDRLRSVFYAVKEGHVASATAAVQASARAHETVLLSFFDPEDEVIKQLNAFQPHRITSYSSLVAKLAEFALAGELTVCPRQVVVSGDSLTAQMEAKIQEAWGAPIYNLYAAAESFFMASKETGQEAWTVIDELNTLEVLGDDDQPVGPGERGRVTLTNLFNYALPILRYELCDYAVRGPEQNGTTTLLDVVAKTHDGLAVTFDNGKRGTIPSYELASFQVPELHEVQFVSQPPDYIRLEYRATREIDETVRRAFQRLLERQGARRTEFDVVHVDRIWNSGRTAKRHLVRTIDEPLLRPRITASSPVPATKQRTRPSNPYVKFEKAEIESSIQRCFERQVAELPDGIAVKDGSDVLTFEALNRAANRLARTLVREERGHETVALLLGPGTAMIVAIIGTLKAGKSYLPLDSSHPPARNASMVKDAEARFVVTDSANLTIARECTADRCRVINVDDIDSNLDDDNLGLVSTPDTSACFLYTSGSTGQPKGVVQSHRNILHRVMAYTNDFHICQNDRLSLVHSYIFSASLRDIFGALLNGATLLPYDLKKRGISNLAAWLRGERLTVFYSVPTIFRHFLATLADESFPDLRLIRLGGEPVFRRDVEGYKLHFSPDCLLVNALATTETGTIRQYFVDKNTAIVTNRVPVGAAVADKEVVILDEWGQEVGVDTVGEIAVKSRYLAKGYWRRPDLNAQAFTPVPEVEGLRLHRTGDLGRFLPDGRLVHVGRLDSRVNVRGHRVETAEIEMALLNQEELREAVVAPSESETGSQILVAYVVPGGQPVPSASEIRGRLETILPAYMIPSTFVVLESLPTLPTGKVDRAALPVPESKSPGQEVRFLAPRNEIEEVVADIWSEVLSVSELGVNDNFLELGGHSLVAFQILSRVRDNYGIDIPIRVFFDAPTVASMAALIAESQTSGLDPSIPGGSESRRSL